MRQPIIAGNWKMNLNLESSLSLVHDIINNLKNLKNLHPVEVILCPPYTVLDRIHQLIEQEGRNLPCSLNLGAQELFWEDAGAYTGAISAPMLADLGCQYVIIGHSERRQYFAETDQTVNKRLKAALSHGLKPILCIGETLAEREASKTIKIVEGQLKGALKNFQANQLKTLILAYEPVWAIGTGRTATPAQAQGVHSFIREQISFLLDHALAENLRILYGGSVKPENISELMAKSDIDGALVGGASLNLDSFLKIINFCGSAAGI